MRLRRKIFNDPPVPLTPAQEAAAIRAAQRAARESLRSLRTARGQYKRYRSSSGEVYLHWPRWQTAYLEAYRGSGSSAGGLDVSTNVPGDSI